MEKYTFKPYKKNFPKLYQREKVKLKKILTKDTKIEHIGSTAVPKLKGKGIIDIIISINKKNIKKIKDKLQKAGYEFKPKAGDKNRFFFEKDYKHKGKIRRVHLQLTHHNSYVWRRSIAVRDYLRKNPKQSKRYAEIKKKAVKKGKGKAYRKYKKSFLDKLEKKALNLFKTKK